MTTQCESEVHCSRIATPPAECTIKVARSTCLGTQNIPQLSDSHNLKDMVMTSWAVEKLFSISYNRQIVWRWLLDRSDRNFRLLAKMVYFYFDPISCLFYHCWRNYDNRETDTFNMLRGSSGGVKHYCNAVDDDVHWSYTAISWNIVNFLISECWVPH